MDIQIISERESQFTFGGDTPVRFSFDGEYQYDVKSEEQLETIRLWAFENNVHNRVAFHWNYSLISITNDGYLDEYPPKLFGHGTRIAAQIIRIRRERSIDSQQ
jgi:hypothetical protein